MTDWIEWFAEENEGRFEGPLPDATPVAVMMLDGEVWDDEPAGEYNWGCVDQPGEIIAYRILHNVEKEKSKSDEYDRHKQFFAEPDEIPSGKQLAQIEVDLFLRGNDAAWLLC